MMAAEERTTTPLATEWTHRSDDDRRRAVDALPCPRRAIGGVGPPSIYGEGHLS